MCCTRGEWTPATKHETENRTMANNTTHDPHTRDRMLEAIAREALGIRTLETRNSDHLDFHEVAVWSLKAALRKAFSVGYEQAVTDREPQERSEDDANLVPPNFACPNCGQRDMDQLICDEDGEHVACQSCGTSYAVMQLD
jgi:hypothetical protein